MTSSRPEAPDTSQYSPPPDTCSLPAHLTDPYQLGAIFDSINEAVHALIQYTVARGLSYKPRKKTISDVT
jgi:hypothetical protein